MTNTDTKCIYYRPTFGLCVCPRSCPHKVICGKGRLICDRDGVVGVTNKSSDGPTGESLR